VKKEVAIVSLWQTCLDSAASTNDFRSDVNLTFDNCMTYHENGSVIYDMAYDMAKKFERDLVENSMMESECRDLLFKFVTSNTNFLGVIPLLPPRCALT